MFKIIHFAYLFELCSWHSRGSNCQLFPVYPQACKFGLKNSVGNCGTQKISVNSGYFQQVPVEKL
jgi:hypothetical protein